MIKIAVFGNRSIVNREDVVYKFMNYLTSTDGPVVLLHGGAEGPAKLITDWAEEVGNISSVLFKPWTMIWSKLDFEPIYFYLRNKQIVENADKVVVFTNGERDSEVYRVINLCERWDKDLTIIEV